MCLLLSVSGKSKLRERDPSNSNNPALLQVEEFAVIPIDLSPPKIIAEGGLLSTEIVLDTVDWSETEPLCEDDLPEIVAVNVSVYVMPGTKV